MEFDIRAPRMGPQTTNNCRFLGKDINRKILRWTRQKDTYLTYRIRIVQLQQFLLDTTARVFRNLETEYGIHSKKTWSHRFWHHIEPTTVGSKKCKTKQC